MSYETYQDAVAQLQETVLDQIAEKLAVDRRAVVAYWWLLIDEPEAGE